MGAKKFPLTEPIVVRLRAKGSEEDGEGFQVVELIRGDGRPEADVRPNQYL